MIGHFLHPAQLQLIIGRSEDIVVVLTNSFHTKLVLAWHLGRRHSVHTMHFLGKLRKRGESPGLVPNDHGRLPPYPAAVAYQFGNNMDFAMLVKVTTLSPGLETCRKLHILLAEDNPVNRTMDSACSIARGV